jgi:V8-like Glu-specific endopeptidase
MLMDSLDTFPMPRTPAGTAADSEKDLPRISVQKRGQKGDLVAAQDAGFEITRKKSLGFFDAVRFADSLREMSRRICRIELNDPQGRMGTGFLVGPQLVLTNYHVLEQIIDGNRKDLAATVKFHFDYYRITGTDRISDGVLVSLDRPDDPTRPWLLGRSKYTEGEGKGSPDNPEPTADELDYALVRLEKPIGHEPPESPRGWIDVPASQPALTGAPVLIIVQHPEKAPIQVAFETEPAVELKFRDLRVRYQVNTEGGSSGSPVFDKEWRLVALHHYGDPSWQAAYNQGIPIGQIRNHLAPDTQAELGKPQPQLPRSQATAAAMVALTSHFESNTTNLTRSEIEKVVATAVQTVTPLARRSTLPEGIRETLDDKIRNAEQDWKKVYEQTSDPVQWQFATDKLKKQIREALQQGRQFNGGNLPPEWQQWSDLSAPTQLVSIKDFRNEFGERQPYIRYLNAYKKLHEVLHVLDRLKVTIQQEQEARLKNGTPITESTSDLLRELIENAENSTKRMDAAEAPTDWIGKLKESVANFLGNDATTRDRSYKKLASLPSQVMRSVNQELVMSARRIKIVPLMSLLDDLDTPNLSPTVLNDLQSFRDEGTSLVKLVFDHDLCQKIDNELRPVKAQAAVNLESIVSWEDTRDWLAELREHRPTDFRVKRCREAAEAFEKNPQLDTFKNLTTKFDDLFKKIDEALLEQTNQFLLQTVALTQTLGSI